MRKCFLDLFQGSHDVLAVTVCRVQNQHVYLCIYQSVSTFQNICGDADRSTAEQATLFVAGRVRELYCLFNILNGDQTLEVAFFVHQRQLFDLVLAENRLCFFHSRAYRSRDQVILGHYFRDRAVIVGQEPHVTVGDDAHQLAHIVYDRHAGDLVLAHQSIGIRYQMIFRQGERIDDNAVFRTLYLIHLVCLLFDAHVLVNDTDAAFTGNGNCHSGFGDGVHCRSHDRVVEPDIAGKSCPQFDHVRCYVRFCRNQQHVVECQSLFSKLFTQFH